MKTGIDIIDRMYHFLIGAGVPALVGGSIYKGNYNPSPDDALTDEFIIINTLPVNDFDVVREAHANVNLFIRDKFGNTDFSRFRNLSSEIQEAINDYASYKSEMVQKSRDENGTTTDVATDLTSEYFTLRIIMVNGPYNDDEVFKNYSTLNIRVKCYIEK